MDDDFARSTIRTLMLEPQPPCAFTVETAVREGRRWLRIRRTAAAMGTALAVVGAVGTVEVVAGGADRSGEVSAPRKAIDPLVRSVEFGWLPDRYSVRHFTVSGMIGPPQIWLGAAPPVGKGGKGISPGDYVTLVLGGPQGSSPGADLEMLGGGLKPSPGMSEGKRLPLNLLEPAPPVNGHRAYWMKMVMPRGGTDGAVRLRWEYAPKAWAWLTFIDGDRGNALKIARAVKMGGKEALRFPFQVRGVPAGLRPTNSSVLLGAPGSGVWEARLILRGEAFPARYQLDKGPPDPERRKLQVSMQPEAVRRATRDDGLSWAKPNRVIDGHKAVYRDLRVGQVHNEELYVLDVNGLTYHVSYTSLEGSGAERIWRALRTYGADPSKWTDRPVG